MSPTVFFVFFCSFARKRKFQYLLAVSFVLQLDHDVAVCEFAVLLKMLSRQDNRTNSQSVQSDPNFFQWSRLDVGKIMGSWIAPPRDAE